MAKKVTKVVKLQVPAGKATPAPPVGPALGQAGVNIMAFVKEYWLFRLLFRFMKTDPSLSLQKRRLQQFF